MINHRLRDWLYERVVRINVVSPGIAAGLSVYVGQYVRRTPTLRVRTLLHHELLWAIQEIIG
jgi:hypothetical protein